MTSAPRNTPAQRDLDFMEAERAREEKRRAAARCTFIDTQIRQVVIDGSRGPKHFAAVLALGADKQDRIYHWAERRNNQRPPAELLAAAHEESEEAMGDYCEELGYERPRRRSRLTAEQRADAAIAALKEFGVAGEAAIRRIDALQPPAAEREP